MPRLTEQEQQEIIRFVEADKPLPDKYPFPPIGGLAWPSQSGAADVIRTTA